MSIRVPSRVIQRSGDPHRDGLGSWRRRVAPMSRGAASTLYEVSWQMTDARRRRGKLYELPAVLTLLSVAMLCGARSLAAVAQWGRDYTHLAPRLGFDRRRRDGSGWRTPCISELHTVLAGL